MTAGKMDKKRLSEKIVSLAELVTRLRGPDGCPWDAKQTDATLKGYVLEEAYEVVDAIDKRDPEEVCGELGDLLFQIMFLAELAAERGHFDLSDVAEKITAKMIRRHPHVFGDVKAEDAEDVAWNWSAIKRKENGSSGNTPLLKSVPAHLPALLRAHRLSERASKVDFDWPNEHAIWEKVEEEFIELGKAISEKNRGLIAEEVGDLIFSLVNLARHWGLNAELVLRDSNRKFLARFEEMEQLLKDSDICLEEATAEQMNEAWETVKKRRI
jgi:MazG family protein